MTREDLLMYVLIGGILLLCIKIYLESDSFNLRCVVSSKDGNNYCVRERKNIAKAADLLAEITIKCKTLVKHVGEKYKNNKGVDKLVTNFNPNKVYETLPTSKFTAYSENKGAKLAFCLNKNKDDSDNLIDNNTLTFVAIHELAHIMTKSIGHTPEFWENFKFLLKDANEIGIYTPEDYKRNNIEYCGMQIKDNPYYDV